METKFRTRFTERLAKKITFPKTSRTKQAYKNECDINLILQKYNKTGQLPALIQKTPSYGDFSDVPQYQDALNIVKKAQEQFDALSAKVRDRFNNDPAKFLEFCNKKESANEMIELGLAQKKPEITPPATDKKPEDSTKKV